MMPVLINEVVSEIVLQAKASEAAPAGGGAETAATAAVDEEFIVRRTTERVLEVLRREWER